MIEALACGDLVLAVTVLLVLVFAHVERQAAADERARLTKAALSVNPAQAAAAIDPAPKNLEPASERRPTPIGL